MPKKSSISLDIGKLFGFWKILEAPDKGRVLCLCTGCNISQKQVLVSVLRRGRSKSCGCKEKDIAAQAFLEKYGVDNPFKKKEIREKAKKTMIEKYGVSYSGQSEELNEKRKATCLEIYNTTTNLTTYQFRAKTQQTSIAKYGTDHPSQNNAVKAKGARTRLQKYGAEHYLQSNEGKQRFVNTSLERYQTANPAKAEEVRKKKKQTNLEKYGVESYLSTNEFQEKKTTTMLEKYGVEHYSQTPEYKQNQKQHYNLLRNEQTVTELARHYDVCHTTLHNVYRDYGEDAVFKYCEQNSDQRRIYSTELAMINLLAGTFENLTRFDKFPPNCRYKPDFRLEKNGKVLYVNIDGLYDHSIIGRSVKGRKDYHFKMREAFINNGDTLFQFREDELRDSPLIVKSIILNYFGVHDQRYNARELKIKEVSKAEATEFFQVNHLMSSHQSAKAFGLFTKDNELVSLISIRYQKKGILEIARFGSKNFCSVRGGFSKLLKHVEKIYKPKVIMSFCDLRYASGMSYDRLGFTLVSTTLGFEWTDKVKTYNRLRCRANMDERGLSQEQYAEELKWAKIYDAGQAKYIKS
jgi:hypothetical protein